jgi:hypothetical protein
MELSLKEMEDAAKNLYNQYTGNHPSIHANRFPSWEELDQKEKNSWLLTAKVRT